MLREDHHAICDLDGVAGGPPSAPTARHVADEGYWPLPDYEAFGIPASEGDSRAIAALMERFVRAWGAEDAEGLVATYAEDAEWVNAYGVVIRGRAALREFLAELFDRLADDVAANEASRRIPVSTRFLGAETAVVHNVTESERTANRDGTGRRRIHVTYVLVKRSGEWQIAHQMIMDARR